MKLQSQFQYISNLIEQTRQKVYQVANTELIELYWNIGSYLHDQVKKNIWGKSIVKQLAEYLKNKQPNIKGFSSQNLWRMKQFFETYHTDLNLSTLLREIPWSHNMAILSSTKSADEREFYIRLVIKEKWQEILKEFEDDYKNKK